MDFTPMLFVFVVSLLSLVRSQPNGCDGDQPLLLGNTQYNGEFWSSNFPASYVNGTSCQFQIAVPDPALTSIIRLELYDFILGPTDWVRVYDCSGAINETCPLLAQFTGGQIPTVVLSSGPSLFVTFQTSTSIAYNLPGFRAAFNSDPACSAGGRLVDFGEVVSSPSYPNNYPPGQLCIWNFVGPEEGLSTFEMVFIDFKLEGTTSTCRRTATDVLEIYVDGTILDRYCGYQYPAAFNVSGQAVRVVFSTNAQIGYPGFLYQVNRYDYTPPPPVQNISTHVIYSYNLSNHSIGYDAQGRAILDQEGRQFRLHYPGKTGLPNSVSIEALDRPGFFLRKMALLQLQLDDSFSPIGGDFERFNNDSTFYAVANKWDQGTISFEFIYDNDPGETYIRHDDLRVEVWVYDGTTNFELDASFVL